MRILACVLLITGVFCAEAFAQRKPVKVKPVRSPSLIFAVLSDGKLLEPIAAIENATLTTGEIAPATLGDAFQVGRSYSVVFGGKKVGNIAVTKSNIGEECGGSSADVSADPAQPKLKGLVMALATNASTSPPGSGVRRLPTAGERSAIEALVRAEFVNQGASAAMAAVLRYHNLTAVDVDKDGIAEMIGSYWIAPPNERRLLFFIAEKGSDGKYFLTHREYEVVKPTDVMSGDLADLDTGLGHELLLDIFDYDRDGTAEIFTIGKAFEGNNYFVYRRVNSKWTKVHENYVYRCAF